MNQLKKEIQNRADIVFLVDDFYAKVREDKLLSPIFNAVIKDTWPEHLNKMYAFWSSVLLYEKSYQGNPFMPHSELPIEKKHFDCWLKLFQDTIEENFIGKIAEEAIWRSNKMAEMFQIKLEYYKHSQSKPLL